MDNDLKKMSDNELAQRMLNYIDQARTLMQCISDFLERKTPRPSRDKIVVAYKQLKEAIKTDAHYVDLVRNRASKSRVYTNIFICSIAEASAFGFTSPTNSQINHSLFSSVEVAHYKLTKYYSREKWSAVAELQDQ